MRNYELKDCIRWLDLGDKMVLQVRSRVFRKGDSGIDTYEEVWIDVPVVIQNQSEKHVTQMETGG